MKDHFIRLFKYDRYATEKLLTVIRAMNNPDKPVQLTGHLLAAQQRWLSRCLKESVAENELFPQQETTPFEELIAHNHDKWIDFLGGLDPSDLDQIITYKNTAGAVFSNTLIDILTQVINHGTHHRAQIGQQLKLAGAESLPPTDYIFFIRN
ncbi:DinB family protein [Mucilaginibacter sp. UR6-11]|uniref:DinB family protein n=1 Tax=Mucilaginibacter sp. UR6-11 TaxID=1435644 RepID=UPI001E3F765D|nr:DinB family protein [Mucilaginibacter sp. UR6-11]MCC8426158.1 DinB family protein [Mucilaginibacter sp. UR6-11]